MLPQGDLLFGYYLLDRKRKERFFVPHRYGGPARIVADGTALSYYEHGVWLWSERGGSAPPPVLWMNFTSEYDQLMYRVIAYSTGGSVDFVSGRSRGWPVTVPRRQRTPLHPGVLPDDRAFELAPG